jgi:hypothetical protein
MNSSFLLLLQLEQIPLYICGFGFSDLFVKYMKMTDIQKFGYYACILCITLIVIYYTKHIETLYLQDNDDVDENNSIYTPSDI